MLCYADNTLMVAGAPMKDRALARAKLATTVILRAKKLMPISIPISKTEVIVFDEKKSQPGADEEYICISEDRIGVNSILKYLEIVLDFHWRFDAICIAKGK